MQNMRQAYRETHEGAGSERIEISQEKVDSLRRVAQTQGCCRYLQERTFATAAAAENQAWKARGDDSAVVVVTQRDPEFTIVVMDMPSAGRVEVRGSDAKSVGEAGNVRRSGDSSGSVAVLAAVYSLVGTCIVLAGVVSPAGTVGHEGASIALIGHIPHMRSRMTTGRDTASPEGRGPGSGASRCCRCGRRRPGVARGYAARLRRCGQAYRRGPRFQPMSVMHPLRCITDMVSLLSEASRGSPAG